MADTEWHIGSRGFDLGPSVIYPAGNAERMSLFICVIQTCLLQLLDVLERNKLTTANSREMEHWLNPIRMQHTLPLLSSQSSRLALKGHKLGFVQASEWVVFTATGMEQEGGSAVHIWEYWGKTKKEIVFYLHFQSNAIKTLDPKFRQL